MSTGDLERELRRWRESDAEVPASNAVPLGVGEALAYRNSGNLPDDLDRTLRLVLLVEDGGDSLDRKRRRYEPDYLEAPSWRRAGSRPVNVVPLRGSDARRGRAQAWWEDPAIGELEAEWRKTGTVAGVVVPAQWRGFVYKTAIALRGADRVVTIDSLANGVARWVSPGDAARIRAALRDANT